ncbi:serrate RNA effector molecule homolog [Labrus mixtus]|uniref:serrate RNA effector molecule homolog n=1 Tax=Labrus mixtus TaxID=508554 RepID=UPI0029BFACA2|nr:serrate RNA effector molecule homolog [Labrus mixtus]
MDEGARNPPSAPAGSQKAEDVVTKRARKKPEKEGPSNPSRKVQDKERRRRRRRHGRTTYTDADLKSDHADKDKMEVVDSECQTQESTPAETQHVDDNLTAEENTEVHKDVRMVQAQTQTRKQKGAHKFTQTPVVLQSDQATQTETSEPKQVDEKTKPGAENDPGAEPEPDKHTPEAKSQDDQAAPLKQNESPEKEKDSAGEQNPPEGSESKGPESKGPESKGAETSDTPTDSPAGKSGTPQSYASAVAGEGGSEKKKSGVKDSKAADKTSQNTR